MDGETLLAIVIEVALVLLLLGVALLLLRLVSRRITRALNRLDTAREERKKQLSTLVGVGNWVVAVLLLFVALMMILNHFVDVTPLLASAGVAGLAVSLGAQTLVRDLIGGIIILLENQYSVGDIVQVGGVEGEVERFTLRATYLRNSDGLLHVVPNGDARIVSNATKDWSRALVEIGVAYEEDVERVLRVLEEAVVAFARDAPCKDNLIETPRVEGPQSLGDWAITVRVLVKTEPGQHVEVARQLRMCLLSACAQAGIELPYPRQEVLVRSGPATG